MKKIRVLSLWILTSIGFKWECFEYQMEQEHSKGVHFGFEWVVWFLLELFGGHVLVGPTLSYVCKLFVASSLFRFNELKLQSLE